MPERSECTVVNLQLDQIQEANYFVWPLNDAINIKIVLGKIKVPHP